jgi:hypothetical protein
VLAAWAVVTDAAGQKQASVIDDALEESQWNNNGVQSSSDGGGGKAEAGCRACRGSVKVEDNRNETTGEMTAFIVIMV